MLAWFFLPWLLAPAEVREQVMLTAPVGGTAMVTVNYPSTWPPLPLLNREAPNLVTLTTPWGKVTARPTGSPQQSREWQAYFAQVQPIILKMPIPRTVQPGRYQASLSAQLFVCDPGKKICARRELYFPATIHVTSIQSSPAVLTLHPSDLRPTRLKP